MANLTAEEKAQKEKADREKEFTMFSTEHAASSFSLSSIGSICSRPVKDSAQPAEEKAEKEKSVTFSSEQAASSFSLSSIGSICSRPVKDSENVCPTCKSGAHEWHCQRCDHWFCRNCESKENDHPDYSFKICNFCVDEKKRAPQHDVLKVEPSFWDKFNFFGSGSIPFCGGRLEQGKEQKEHGVAGTGAEVGHGDVGVGGASVGQGACLTSTAHAAGMDMVHHEEMGARKTPQLAQNTDSYVGEAGPLALPKDLESAHEDGPCIEPSHVVKKSFLSKKKERTDGSVRWTLRFFVLTKGGRLAYFTGMQMRKSERQGSISLLQKDTMFMVAAQNFSEGDQMGFPFVIFDRSGTGSNRKIIVCAKNEQDRDDWIQAINHILSHRGGGIH